MVGDQKTVQGATVAVTVDGDSLKVEDPGLVCGGVSTAYAIDTVLMLRAN
jgi:uncharacterized surface protein with fasciclin (FAS1) repeats